NETSTTTNYVHGSGVSSITHVLAGTVTGESSVSIGYSQDNELALLVRADAYDAASAGYSANGLDGANICVGIGTWMESELVYWFSSRNIAFTSVPVAGSAEATAKFIDGSCDAMVEFRLALEELQENLHDGGLMNGVDTWITNSVGAMVNGSDYSWLAGWSFLNLTISQSNGEASYLHYAYAEITLTGTCVSNCSNQDDTISQTIAFDLEESNPLLGIIFDVGEEPVVQRSSSCEQPFDESEWPGMFGPYGLECDLTL
ncbi:uncharacterized protein METZ01_LOCUS446147, partial [marine metagenome]